MIAVVFWFFWVFCTGPNPTRATKFGLYWQFKPKLAFIMLSKASIGLVIFLSWYPVAFKGMLDFCGVLMVLFISLRRYCLEPLPSLRSFGSGLFFMLFFVNQDNL